MSQRSKKTIPSKKEEAVFAREDFLKALKMEQYRNWNKE